MSRIGLIVNPIAGMGGRVGLKGTDGVVAEAERRGARPTANERATESLRELKRLLDGAPAAPAVEWHTASGAMGEDALRSAGFTAIEVVHQISAAPSAHDTRTAIEALLAKGVDLILFCGGDGTARDICTIIGRRVPMLGIPAGVKMYSGVFGTTPAATAFTVMRYLLREIDLAQVDILDLDEERYRQDEWAVRLYMSASTPFEPTSVQTSKALIAGIDEQSVRADIAAHLEEEIRHRPDCLFLLGPGSTMQAVSQALHVHKTLLGIDAIIHDNVVGTDLAERQILELLARYRERKLVLSPIGAQGFILGRGNQPLSPAVIRMIDPSNIILVATPAKLARTPFLRFDTGDSALDADLTSRKFMTVIVGYHRTRLVRTAG